MPRTFLTRTILVLLPTLLAAGWVARAYLKDTEHFTGFKLGIDLKGGTILVYEVDQDASKLQSRGSDGGRVKADAALAGALKRRIDPADLLGVVIRPIGESRVEILLPYGSQADGGVSQGEVERIKDTIKEVGSLEFRILANTYDDGPAISDAEKYLLRGQEKDSDEAKALANNALLGLPPPFPNKPPGDVDEYLVKAADETPIPVQYAWVELDKVQRAHLGISSSKPGVDGNHRDWNPVFAAARDGNRIVTIDHDTYYSRPCVNAKIPQSERDQKKFDFFVLSRISDKDRVLVGGDVAINAFVDIQQNGSPSIGFNFNGAGGDKFYAMTSRNKPTTPGGGEKVSRELAILLDGRLISSANILTGIRDRGQITGSFDRGYVDRIVNLLRAGALPATLKALPVSENTIGPTLGADTIRSGTLSVVLAFAAVLVFMIVYYRFAGLVATVALLANLLLTLGFMVAVNATFTLPGLAGLVLMLGMAVDANVLIYERVREERDRGMNLITALRNGYDRALPTIIDTHLSSIFTAVVLYVVGNDQLKGFGVSLTVGLIISLFTSLFMTRLLFDFWQSKNWLTQLRMMRLFSKPNINFMKIRYQMFALTGFLTIAGVSLFLIRGQKGLNVDFIGGTAYSGKLEAPMDIGGLRKLLNEDRQREVLKIAEVTEQPLNPDGKNKNTYVIKYADGGTTTVALSNAAEGNNAEERAKNVAARASFLPDASVEQIFSGGQVGNTSSLFTVRTTERERELVEASINHLFQEGGKDLLVKNEITSDRNVGDDYFLTFKSPVSKSAIRTLFERQFQIKLGEGYVASDVFEVIEQGKETDGRYSEMTVHMLRDANEGIKNLVQAGQIKEVVEAAKKEFAQKPQPERLETFDGTLASETRTRALYAILASWAAILLYLWFRFGSWTFGAAAVICLIHDLCFTLGAIALCYYLHHTWVGTLLGLQDFKIDLPAVAALLTLVGYSVNDTIVVFDRIKEVRGKSALLTPQMINDSVNQTLSRTILAATTVFLVVLVLYVFGGEGLHLFAFVMVMGVVVGTYSSIYIASPLLLIFGEGRVHHHHGHQPVEAVAQPA
ncbi:MAG TPA: protein translocase subunit SecD [Gemmataceae bacterium]|nr:protein translocase subunit SecD [Gemmataceae bacterium]